MSVLYFKKVKDCFLFRVVIQMNFQNLQGFANYCHIYYIMSYNTHLTNKHLSKQCA